MSEKKECVTHYACDCIQARLNELESEDWKLRWEATCADRDLLDECNIRLNERVFELEALCDRYRTALEKIARSNCGRYLDINDEYGEVYLARDIAKEALESK